MHILLLYQYYHNPDCAHTGRHYTFAKHWAERHRVTIIGSSAFRSRRLTNLYPWAPEGVDVLEVRSPYDNAASIPARTVSYASYATGAMYRSLRMERPDVIIGSSTPLSAAWAARAAAHFRGVPWVFEVRDLWPDFPIQMGAVPWPPVQRMLRRLEINLYKSAAHIVTLSSDMEREIAARGIPSARITTLPNGTDLDLAAAVRPEDAARLRKEHGLEGKRVVLYAGTFGRANDIATLIQAVREVSSERSFCFIFCGQGYHEPDLHEAAAVDDRIRLLPPQPRHEIFKWFTVADLSLVSFIDLPVLAANSPAKFFDSLVVGTPVVVTNSGWTRNFVEKNRCGWYVPAGNPRRLAEAVTEILSDAASLRTASVRAATAARAGFDRSIMAANFEDILAKAVRRRDA